MEERVRGKRGDGEREKKYDKYKERREGGRRGIEREREYYIN